MPDKSKEDKYVYEGSCLSKKALIDFFDGKYNEADFEKIQNHVLQCKRCLSILEQIMDDWQLKHDLEHKERFKEGIRKRIEARRKS